MRIAVLGVGLIGGSIGLAAHEYTEGAELVGYGRDPERLRVALERGAIDRAAGSVAEAVHGADLCFACAPVGTLPRLVAEALDAAGPDCVVSDVGSTKQRLLAGMNDPRFVGGHPIAGAETAGVEHARADLFQGAAWYLIPLPRSEGLLYERLHRFVVDVGARPVAVDPDTHDRVVAVFSHLPHVLANVLASQAADRLLDHGEALRQVGPSFRDATRVAGANTRVWADIYRENRAALARELRSFAERRPGGAGAGQGGGEHRRHGARAGGGHALGRDDAVDRRRCPGGPGRRADRRAGLPRRRAVTTVRFEPGPALSGDYVPPPDKSISHRAALFGAMADEPVIVRNYLDSRDTRSTIDALLKLGAAVDEETGGTLLVRGVGLRAPLEATGGPPDRGNP